MSDPYELEILGDLKEQFELGIKLLLRTRIGGTKSVQYYEIHPQYGFIIYWIEKKLKLPFPLKEEEFISFAWAWLKSLTPDKYPPEPVFDGTIHRGFLISTNFPNAFELKFEDRFYAIGRIAPAWTEFHK